MYLGCNYHLCSSGKILVKRAKKPLRFTTGYTTKSIFFSIPDADLIITEIQSPVPSPGRGNRYIYLPGWPVAASYFTLTRLGEHFQGSGVMVKSNMICKQRGGGGGGKKTREGGERENIHRKLNFRME